MDVSEFLTDTAACSAKNESLHKPYLYQKRTGKPHPFYVQITIA